MFGYLSWAELGVAGLVCHRCGPSSPLPSAWPKNSWKCWRWLRATMSSASTPFQYYCLGQFCLATCCPIPLPAQVAWGGVRLAHQAVPSHPGAWEAWPHEEPRTHAFKVPRISFQAAADWTFVLCLQDLQGSSPLRGCAHPHCPQCTFWTGHFSISSWLILIHHFEIRILKHCQTYNGPKALSR